MNLVFETVNGNTAILAVKGSDTLETIKAKIQKIVLTDEEFQGDSFINFDLQSCSRVNLVLPLFGMHIIINYDTTGRKFILEVDGSYGIGQVISMIKKKESGLTKKNKLVLSFNGTNLVWHRTLDDYHIQNNDSLNLHLENL